MKRKVKDLIYDQFSRCPKALSNPKRLEILDLLTQGEKTVETIAEQADLGVKNASAQLKELRSALLVSSRRDGKNIYYSIANEGIKTFLLQLRRFNEFHFSEVQKIASDYLGEEVNLKSTSRKQLLAKAKKGDVILLDVRPPDEYAYGHLPYAVSVPISNLSKELKRLPKDKEIVAYCRGPYCFFATEAVELLRKKGYKVSRLSDSLMDWAAEGLPIESSKVSL